MKIKLFFDTVQDFADFILASASIELRSVPGTVFERIDNPTFLGCVIEIQVSTVTYTLSKCEMHNLERPMVVNYMCNAVQRAADHVFILNLMGQIPKGSQAIREFFEKQLPEKFELRTGWRTDFEEFVFTRRENALTS
jgi:hypothetical protein